MFHNQDRRQNIRVNVNIPMTLNVNSEYFTLHVCNLSLGGALAVIEKGNPLLINNGDSGSCFMEYEGYEFASNVVLLRRIENKLAFQFADLTQDHMDILQLIVSRSL